MRRLILAGLAVVAMTSHPSPAAASEEVVKGATIIAAAAISCPRGTVPERLMASVLADFQVATGFTADTAAIVLNERATVLAARMRASDTHAQLCEAVRRATLQASTL